MCSFGSEAAGMYERFLSFSLRAQVYSRLQEIDADQAPSRSVHRSLDPVSLPGSQLQLAAEALC